MYNGETTLFEPYQGLIRGNMFINLYDGYGKIYDIKPLNEQAELLTYIDMYCFACIDLELYLDLNPNNTNALNLYRELNNEKQKYMNIYESKYGQLTTDYVPNNMWNWATNKWPWEV